MKLVKKILLVTFSFVLLCGFTKQEAKDSFKKDTKTTNNEEYSVVYQEYEKLSDEQKAKFGVIPPKTVIESNISLLSPKKNSYKIGVVTYPATYDLRNVDVEGTSKNFAPDVRNQGNLGLCWAFSLNSMLESYLKTHGNETSYNFSENQLDMITNIIGDEHYLGEGATYRDGIKAWFAGYAPQTETTFGMSYTDDTSDYVGLFANDANYMNNKDVAVDVEGVELFDNIISPDAIANPLSYKDLTEDTNVNAIKEYIMNNGAISTSTLVPDDFGNTSQMFLYANVNVFSASAVNAYMQNHSGHALTIIGWDDNYGDINNDGVGDGAWLVQNSWGETKPYIWISYYDSFSIIDRYGITGVNNTIPYDYIYGSYNYDKNYSSLSTTFNFYVGEDAETLNSLRLNVFANDETPTVSITSDNNTICNSTYPTSTVNSNISFNVENCVVKGHVKATITGLDSIYPEDQNYVAGFDVDAMLTTINDTEEVKMDIRVLEDESTNFTDRFYNYDGYGKRVIGAPKNVDMDDYDFEIAVDTPDEIVIQNVFDGNFYLKNSYFKAEIYQNDFFPKDMKNLYLSIVPRGATLEPYVDLISINPIESEVDLLDMENSTGNYELFNDIDLTRSTSLVTGAYYNSGEGFTAFDFYGNLDGKGHKIIGLNSTSGLFDRLGPSIIQNLSLVDFNIIDDYEDLILFPCGTLANSASNVAVNNVMVDNAKIDCAAAGGLFATTEGFSVINNVHIKDSDIKAESYAGGIVGYIKLSNEIDPDSVAISNNFVENTAIYSNDVDNYPASSTSPGYITGSLLLRIDPSNAAPSFTTDNNIFLKKELNKDGEEVIDNSFIGMLIKYITDGSNYNIIPIFSESNNVMLTTETSVLSTTYENFSADYWTVPTNSTGRLKSFDLSNKLEVQLSLKEAYSGKVRIDATKKTIVLPPGVDGYDVYYSMFDIGDNDRIQAYNLDGTVKTNHLGLFGTGSAIRIYNNDFSTTYGVVVKGDILADGEIDIRDFKKLANYVGSFDADYQKNIMKTSDYIEAGDFNSDGEIDIRDFKKLANYVASF